MNQVAAGRERQAPTLRVLSFARRVGSTSFKQSMLFRRKTVILGRLRNFGLELLLLLCVFLFQLLGLLLVPLLDLLRFRLVCLLLGQALVILLLLLLELLMVLVLLRVELFLLLLVFLVLLGVSCVWKSGTRMRLQVLRMSCVRRAGNIVLGARSPCIRRWLNGGIEFRQAYTVLPPLWLAQRRGRQALPASEWLQLPAYHDSRKPVVRDWHERPVHVAFEPLLARCVSHAPQPLVLNSDGHLLPRCRRCS